MKATLLLLASLLFAVLLSEIALRLFTPYGTNAPAMHSSTAAVTSDKPLDVEDAMRYVTQLPVAPGTDRHWFIDDPPPLPNRAPASGERMERYKDYERRGLFGPQADYVWNRRFIESSFCAPNSQFQNYPNKIMVFDPPAGNPHPRYRFPPNTNTASGLVTNAFGLRGRPITLAKPPKTVRIAYVGASTTINNHNFPFSYPERVAYWLDRFAEANHLDVRFEALNAGREGLNSEDMPAIVHDELLPLDPDLAVYYEGANQFPSAHALLFPPFPARQTIGAVDQHIVPEVLRTHLATGNLLDRALNGFTSAGEPRKPPYRLVWPAGVNEQNPDVDSPKLPLLLPVIVKDLDSIRQSMQSIGGQLALCSFEWLAKDGMPLSLTRHENIYKQLNTVLWPLRYADIRRLADFQNRVYRRYAETRGIPFLDVVSTLPQDPNLFSDAIHMTDTGERVKAWIVFQQLVPIIRKQIESGQLPRPRGSHGLPPPPSMAISEMSMRCGDAPPGTLTRINGVVSLDAIRLAYPKASIHLGHPVQVITADERWAYAAAFTLHVPASLSGPAFLYMRGRVVNGQIGLGVLDHKSNTFQPEKNVAPSPGLVDIYVPVLYPERADELIVRNTAEGGVRSEMLIEDVGLVVSSKTAPK